MRQTLFGTDFPLITPDRWMEDFATLDLKPEVRSAILKENALRILGIGHVG
jgi:predicted TIM-barrel fold metal-dependent hydrolase